MKKILLSILITILVLLLGYTVIVGWGIGGFQVLSFGNIISKDDNLQTKLDDVTRLSSVDYRAELSNQKIYIQNLKDQKEEYKELVESETTVDENGVEVPVSAPAAQLEKYEMEYLWTQIGNHAKAQGVTLTIDVEKSFDPKEELENEEQQNQEQNGESNTNTTEETNTTTTSDMEAAVVKTTSTGADQNDDQLYNLKFKATGPYVAIADFIYAIENDSTLGFKIEDFKMAADATSDTRYVTGEFICKDIRIKTVTLTTQEQEDEKYNPFSDEEEGNTTSTNQSSSNSSTQNKTNTSRKFYRQLLKNK